MTARPDLLPLGEVIALASDPIVLFDVNGGFRACNTAFRQVFRRLDSYLAAGTSWDIFLSEATRHGQIDEATARSLDLIESRLMDRPDAHPEVIGPVPDLGVYRFGLTPTSDGGFALTLTLDGDTDRGASEREFEQIMSKVLEACPTCLTMSRIGDGQILYRSPSATELLGKGLNSKEHFVQREERADFITALLPSARVDDMRITARRADGSPFAASISARLIDYRGEDVIVSSIDDLTEMLETEDELSRQREQIFQSEKMSALGEVLAGVAHELNNPLSIVVGNAHILLEEDTDPATHKRVEKLSEAAERCVRIVRTFLSLARERPLSFTEISASVLIGRAIAAFRDGQPDTTLNVFSEIVPGLPLLLVDEVQIVQVLTNLMTNAHQAITETGTGGTIKVSAAPGTTYGDIRIQVTDDGPGVPDDLAGRIFDPLFTTKLAGKGTGIGLALCQRIVLAHKGMIRLERDRAGRGACFTIDLPGSSASR